MLSTAGAARVALTSEGLDSIRGFLVSAQHGSGAFRDRASQPDLYYTVFGIESCLALDAPFDRDRAASYVSDPGALDLVHHCCRIRCAARLRLLSGSKALARKLRSRLNRLVMAAVASGSGESVKAAFLAAMAYEDLGGTVPRAKRALHLLARYEQPDGSFANVDGGAGGLTTATAAAAIVHRRLTGDRPMRSLNWLRKLYVDSGGFRVARAAPEPDLLSTATALFALHYCGESLDDIAVPCEDFIAGLWRPCGGFAGHMGDATADCEYTYYALLALGCLA